MTAKPVRPYEPAGIALSVAIAVVCAGLSFAQGGWLGISGGVGWTVVAAGLLLFLPSSIRDYRQRRDTPETPAHEGHRIGTRHGGKR